MKKATGKKALSVTIIKYIRNFFLLFIGISISLVILFRFIPVYFTPLMGIRCTQQMFNGEEIKCRHSWVPLEKMSGYMPRAVIASEDGRFTEHHGFDFKAIKQAMKEKEERGRIRGASTISQQTAKNVFLWPSSTWLRKGLEAYFTILIEIFWSKERIMEVYLNSIETGDGIYGIEAVAKEHFNKEAKHLTKGECALIAVSLPNPRKFNSAKPTKYMLKRKATIMRFINSVTKFPKTEEK